MPKNRLHHISLDGFTSIKEMELQLEPINVLIGGNAAGKSNLVSFFRLIGFMLTESLQTYIARQGSARSILYYGPQHTRNIEATLEFRGCKENTRYRDEYYMRLTHVAEDKLMFADERLSYHMQGHPEPRVKKLGHGHKESKLNKEAQDDETVEVVRNIMRRCKTFQFHDTSLHANIRGKCYLDQNQFLYDDAGNLSAYLYSLKKSSEAHYEKIRDTIKRVAPQFDDFELRPDRENERLISLQWREPGSSYIFGPHQLSDGLLRFMALTTLLLQPKEDLPDVIVIDEPELGLHPYAIRVLAGLVRKASANCQIVLATQSTSLVNEFEAEHIITVDRKRSEPSAGPGPEKYTSEFTRLDPEELKDWLQEYSISELWDKNVLGGTPAR